MTTHITFDDIKNRLSEISNERSRLDEEEKALKIVLNTFFKEPPKTQYKQKLDIEPIDKQLLVNQVRELFGELEGKEFTVADVFEMLAEQGKAPEDKNKVSMVLSKLLIKKEIIAIKKGVGRSPSIYKVATSSEDDSNTGWIR